MRDRHYTPPALAASLIEAVSRPMPTVIADFAAGRGDLLRHAAQQWPTARIIANDLDSAAVRYLRRRWSAWITRKSDFLALTSPTQKLHEFYGKVDLVLMNPPFSCRGASAHFVTFRDHAFRCSTALAFLIAALPFLSADGELLAIVPKGCLQSEKDSASWQVLRTMFHVSIVTEVARGVFSGCAVKSAVLRLSARSRFRLRVVPLPASGAIDGIIVQRGTLPLHRAVLRRRKSVRLAFPFVHTTSLRNNAIENTPWTDARRSVVVGPAVLLSRVGRPDQRKIAMLERGGAVVLSDCVIALRCVSDTAAIALTDKLISNFPLLSDAYGGTCAPYLTLTGLRAVLSAIEAAQTIHLNSGQVAEVI
jgi:predicted RNA methylase